MKRILLSLMVALAAMAAMTRLEAVDLWSFLAKGHWQSVTGNDSPAEHEPVKE